MSKQMKQLMAEELAERHSELKNCVVMSYVGVSATEADELRKELRKQGASMEVLRNRIAGHAFEKIGLPKMRDFISGPSAMIYGEDIAELCKVYRQWAKNREQAAVHGGLADGQPIMPEDVARIADLPPVEVLRGQMDSLIARQIGGLAQGVNSLFSSMVRALDEIRKQKEQQ